MASAAVLLVLLVTLGSITPLEDRKYLAALEAEIARLEPQARKAVALDRSIDHARARARLLDDFQQRAKIDLDALSELTKILRPPTWLNSLEMTRAALSMSGQTEQAENLLKLLDRSPFFQGSEFTVPLTRQGKLEAFRIHAARKGVVQ